MKPNTKFEMNKDYVVVTTISTHRMRYVMHKDDLQKLGDVHATDADLCDWAMDTVTMEECEEFSQHWLGEQISDVYECDEDEMLTFFDRDNSYLSSWSRDYKVQWARNLLTKDKDE